MASIYANIKNAKDLLFEVRMHGFSTKQEDICRAQDIFGNSPYDELVRLANDNGRKNSDGEPDPNGSISDGSAGTRAVFYQVLFHIWSWEDATKFYNENSNPMYQEGRKAVVQVREQKKQIENLNEQLKQEHQARQAEIREKLEAIEKANVLEGRVHDCEMTIMELKAKLYDLMTKEQ